MLTWKQSLEDLVEFPSWNWDHPFDSAKDFVKSIPTNFAISVVIGGHSVENTVVRVDGVDIMNYKTGEIYYSNRLQWYNNYTLRDTENVTSKTFELDRSDIPVEDVRIFVWLTIQKSVTVNYMEHVFTIEKTGCDF
ncbi:MULTISPECIES: hypothetical protein [Caldisericum]|uniref:Uncharacterized protein n=1 Tax=Caldisericum exile TaxID=693075 RepID=A0A2J6WEM5_9BACT|nr:MAG: hypothetical protein C0189_02705 [Caldisericum exile]